jgi:hypothetical protein
VVWGDLAGPWGIGICTSPGTSASSPGALALGVLSVLIEGRGPGLRSAAEYPGTPVRGWCSLSL